MGAPRPVKSVTVMTVRSRRIEYAESTRAALVDSAIELMTERGYSGTSLDAVAKRARVTKGALYHHFGGKQALFEAVVETVGSAVVDRLTAIVAKPGDPWENAMQGVRAYLQVCLEPTYQRILLHEAPVVMGWERWREAEDRLSFGLFRDTVGALVEMGAVCSQAPVEAMARLLFGAVSSGAQYIAGTADQKSTYAEVSMAIEDLFGRLRADPPGAAR